MDHIKFPNNKHRRGSALILVVVLTALLAVIGTIFLLSSRVESMSTSGIAENKALKSAVDDIIAKISDTLTNDVPGVRVDPSGNPLEEYYDYPGLKDKWLASIEPYRRETAVVGTFEYIWPQITDLTGVLQNQDDIEKKFATRHVRVTPQKSNVIIEYPEIMLNDDGSWLRNGNMADTANNKDDGINKDEYRGQLADADGDGITDSKWIKLTDVSTGKGKDIYAAIRIIDNGGMINVNTAYNFDPDSTTKNHVDGTTQLNIDLDELCDSNDTTDALTNALCSSNDLYSKNNYQNLVLRRIESPDDPDYKPFDISDDLALRSRFCVDPNSKGRLRTAWKSTLHLRYRTFDSSTHDGLDDWQKEICRDILNFDCYKFEDEKCDRRHMLTCWNMDRIINPVGGKMFGVNGQLDNMGIYDQKRLFKAIKKALDSTGTALNTGDKAAQITANLIDYIDSDLKMTVINPLDMDDTLPPTANDKFYGFEGPCVYISEIAVICEANPDYPTDPRQWLYSYAIELYNPYAAADDAVQPATVPGDSWYLQIGGGAPIQITWPGTGKFHVMLNKDTGATGSFAIAGSPSSDIYPAMIFSGGKISLVRKLYDGTYKEVDSFFVPADLVNGTFGTHNIVRDIKNHKCIKKLWNPTITSTPGLGIDNSYNSPDQTLMQAHPANKPLDCIGDIGNIFAENAYDSTKDYTEEESVKINLANPIYQNLFQYLTVFDPNNDNIDNDGDGALKKDDKDQDGPEWKIPGRININTAPWFVLAQLPWVSKEIDRTTNAITINYELSKAIVAYRDKIKIDDVDYSQGRYSTVGSVPAGVNEDVGFRSIGELNFVVDNPTPADNLYSMWRYRLDSTDLDGYPDLTKIDTNGDGIIDNTDIGDASKNDFEERDVIFARISNLVTVRSDVFTAYMLVRVGVDGPQQRAIAVFDRSNVYPNPNVGPNLPNYIGKVKIRAFQMVSGIR